MSIQLDADAVLAAGAAISRTSRATPDAAPYAVIPTGYKIEPLEKTLPAPLRASGTTVVHDAESFVELVDQLRSDRTRIYFDEGKATFTAVFNDTIVGEPGWRDHRAVYACPLAQEWIDWTAIDGQQKTQEQFAAFVEDHVAQIVKPLAAAALEISRSLEAKKSVNFASSIRLENGANEFTYEETIQGSAAKGRLEVPDRFTLGLSVLKHGAPYALDARLRYRIHSGRLLLWFDLVHPQKIRDDALAEVRKTIGDATRLKVLNGAV